MNLRFTPLFITFISLLLGFFLIFVGLYFSSLFGLRNEYVLFAVNNSSIILILMLLTTIIFLPIILFIKVIEDWSIKPKTLKEKYFRRANDGIGLHMFINCILGIYGLANFAEIINIVSNNGRIDLIFIAFFTLGIVLSEVALTWGMYNLAKCKGYSGLYAILSFLHPIGLLFLANKLKSK